MTNTTLAGGGTYDPAAFQTHGAALAFVASVLESSTHNATRSVDLQEFDELDQIAQVYSGSQDIVEPDKTQQTYW